MEGKVKTTYRMEDLWRKRSCSPRPHTLSPHHHLTQGFSLREAQVETVTWTGKTQTAGRWTVAPLRYLFSLSTRALQCVASGKSELLCVDSGLQRCAERYRDRRARESCKSHSVYYDLASDVMQPHFYCILSVKTVTRRGEIVPTSWWRCGRVLTDQVGSETLLTVLFLSKLLGTQASVFYSVKRMCLTSEAPRAFVHQTL